ncbi:MAG: Dabb family protein [Acidobacteria bacterium]|nr:Dabb family protein [Acidobacteriota bacterium]
MIAHVVLFRPRADLTDADRQRLLDDLTAAVAAIPEIRRLRIGRRMVHGLPGYEQAMHEDFEYAALMEFDDVDGLRAYLAHPSHAEVGRHFIASAAAALAYDYELVDVADGG